MLQANCVQANCAYGFEYETSKEETSEEETTAGMYVLLLFDVLISCVGNVVAMLKGMFIWQLSIATDHAMEFF